MIRDWLFKHDLPVKNGRGQWINLPSWFTFVFGGVDRLPRSQGHGSRWRPNIYRYIRKYYREGWNDVYTLKQWIRKRYGYKL